MAISTSLEFSQLVKTLAIDYNPAEFHGFLSGLVAGGIQDNSWQTLTYQFTNDGHAFSQSILTPLSEFYQQLGNSFDEANTLFSLWLPEKEDGFTYADALADWTNHFLLGLGLAQSTLSRETNEVGEALDDLEEITKLGYDENDDSEELLDAAEEIIEYLRIVVLFLHSHFSKPIMQTEQQIQIH